MYKNYGHIAQRLVQWSHKPSVVGSSPTMSTKKGEKTWDTMLKRLNRMFKRNF